MVRIDRVLAWLAAAIGLLAYLPLFPYLDPVARAFLPLAWLAGRVAERWGMRRRGAVLAAAVVILFFYYIARLPNGDLVAAAVAFLTVLLGARLAGERNPRTYLQLFVLAFLALAASSLFSLSAWFLAALGLLLVLVAVSLVLLTFRQDDPDCALPARELWRLIGLALLLPVGSLPLIIFFFFLLPRTQFPLWSNLQRTAQPTPVASERVEPGAVPTLDGRALVVFRAAGPRLSEESLYWRATVLNEPVGNAWVRGQVPAEESVPVGGTPVTVTMYPEPGGEATLVTLQYPRHLRGVRVRRSPDQVFSRTGGTEGRLAYDSDSSVGGILRVRGELDRGRYLKLPDRTGTRILAEGQRISQQGGDAATRITLAEAFFLDQSLFYATRDLPVGGDPLDRFLFVTKRGNCEFFAAAFVTLLRAAGVSARLVGGYLGGDYNDLGGFYVVTEERAHVWVEAFVPGTGWVSSDPSRLAVNGGRGRAARRTGVLHSARLVLDYLDYSWNVLVVTYDLDRQIRLALAAREQLQRAHLSDLRQPGLGWLLLAVPVAILTLAGALRWRRRTPAERLRDRFLRTLQNRFGVAVTPSTGLFALAHRLQDERVNRFVDVYGAACYSDRSLTTGELRLLRNLLREIRRKVPVKFSSSADT